MVSSDGKLLTSFVRSQQESVPLAKISAHVKQALIATEDQRFYDHRGVDPRRTLGAAFRTLTGDSPGTLSTPVQLGIAFLWGYAFIHYYLDSKIWRVRRDPAVGQALKIS